MNIFKCDICGNLAELIDDTGVPIVCCGQEMTKQKANLEETVFEKHIPFITEEDGKIKVQVGQTIHPMIDEHHIEWIAMVIGDNVYRKSLKPGQEPIVYFQKPVENYEIYEYCNIHGLYKNS